MKRRKRERGESGVGFGFVLFGGFFELSNTDRLTEGAQPLRGQVACVKRREVKQTMALPLFPRVLTGLCHVTVLLGPPWQAVGFTPCTLGLFFGQFHGCSGVSLHGHMRVIEDCLTAKNCKKCMLVSLVMNRVTEKCR